MLRLLFSILFALCVLQLSSQNATLFIYAANGQAFNIALNETDTSAKSATGFEVINIETEIQGLSVFVNNLPAYKKRVFMRLGDTTMLVIKNNQLIYTDTFSNEVMFTKIDAKSLKVKDSSVEKPDIKTSEDKTNTEVPSAPVRYSYDGNDKLGADNFVLPGKEVKEDENPCSYTLDDKDLRRLKSKLKLFPDAFDQKRMLEEDLEFTCYTSAQMLEILNNVDSDEAKYLLMRRIWKQCSDPKEILALQATFKDSIYRKDFSDFIDNRINE